MSSCDAPSANMPSTSATRMRIPRMHGRPPRASEYGVALGEKSPLAASQTTAYSLVMNYLTVEVEIDHGRVSSKGAEALPEKASGLLTILEPKTTQPRPIGLATGQFTVPDDFNAPLPEDVMRTLEGK
jgi:hypothetical protein